MKHKVLVAAALLCVTLGVTAQNPKNDAKPDPAMEAMMQAMMPGEAHKALEDFVGTWDAKVTMWGAPGAPPATSTGTAEAKWVLGGRYVEQHFRSTFMGQPFEGVGYSGYDNVKKQYWGTWIDNVSTGIMVTTGIRADDGKKWTFVGEMTEPGTNRAMGVHELINVHGRDHHVFEMWITGPDGKPFKNLEIEYKRKK